MEWEITEDTEWRSYDGRYTKFKDLEDDHLLNILAHFEQHYNLKTKGGVFKGYRIKAYEFLKDMAEKRGLKRREKQVPHKMGDDWKYYDIVVGEFYLVGERKLNRDICKKCRLNNNDWKEFWLKEDDELAKEGKSLCFLTRAEDEKTPIDEIPEGCHYYMEQIVMKGN